MYIMKSYYKSNDDKYIKRIYLHVEQKITEENKIKLHSAKQWKGMLDAVGRCERGVRMVEPLTPPLTTHHSPTLAHTLRNFIILTKNFLPYPPPFPFP